MIFQTCKIIEPKVVQATQGETTLLAKVTVLLPIGTKTIQEAYHSPRFSSHIVAEHPLSDISEVIFSFSIMGRKECLLFKKDTSVRRISYSELIAKTDCTNVS